MVVMVFLLNPDEKEFIPEAGRLHHHSRERYMGSRGSGEAGHSVGMHARQEGWECQPQSTETGRSGGSSG